MNHAHSRFLDGSPRLHCLEWNRGADGPTLVLLHGNSANAWWWQQFADAAARRFRLIAIDQRGHGDSEWVRPPAYSPQDYAGDLGRVVRQLGLTRPFLAGHSMGGISVLAFVKDNPAAARAAVAIDVAVTSSRGRDRYLSRLKALPTVTYADLATARSRFRLMPKEGDVPPEALTAIAERSFLRTADGRYSLKFDRESFFGGDGLNVLAAIEQVRVPLLLMRGEFSRIMTAESSARAAGSNPRAHLVVIPGTHHHLILERPDLVASEIERFIAGSL